MTRLMWIIISSAVVAVIGSLFGGIAIGKRAARRKAASKNQPKKVEEKKEEGNK